MANDPKAAPAAASKPKRARSVIYADLQAARDELARMRPLCEADGEKQRRQAVRIERAQALWKQTHDPEDPFDPNAFDPPLKPYHGDEQLHRLHHRQHYLIAELEKEYAAAAQAEDLSAETPATSHPVVAQVLSRVKANAQARAEAEGDAK